MSVHYKFGSTLSFDTVSFDGLHISVGDLKKEIFHQKRIGKNTDFDLRITDAQTKQDYTDDNALIAKNTSLIVARVPLTAQQKRAWARTETAAPANAREDPNLGHAVDLTRLNGSEEDKIHAMITQSTQEYDPSNYMRIRGANQTGPVPTTYRCRRCFQGGHWIKNCPFRNIAEPSVDVKKSTGIPRSFMVPVDGPEVPGAMITPAGHYAVPAIDHQAYKDVKKARPAFSREPEPVAEKPEIPQDLLCNLCKDLLTDAVMIECCGNSFCDECIRTFLLESEEHQCPVCNEKGVSPETLIPTRFLRKAVMNFKNETGYDKLQIYRSAEKNVSVEKEKSRSPTPEPKTEEKSESSQELSTQPLEETPSVDSDSKESTPEAEVKPEVTTRESIVDEESEEIPPPPGTEPALPLPSVKKSSEHGDDEDVELPSHEKDDYEHEYPEESHARSPRDHESYQQPHLSPNQAPNLPYPPGADLPAPVLPNFSQPPPNIIPYTQPPPPVVEPYMPPHHVPMYHQQGPAYETPHYDRAPYRTGYRGTNYRGTGYRGTGYRGSGYRGGPPRHHFNGAVQHPPMRYEPNVYKPITTGVIDDPLAAFERILREKDERDRKLRKQRRRSPRHSRSRSYSRSRSRSYSRRSPSRRSRSRTPPKKRYSRSPVRPRERSRERSRELSTRYRSPIRSPPRAPKERPESHGSREGYYKDRPNYRYPPRSHSPQHNNHSNAGAHPTSYKSSGQTPPERKEFYGSYTRSSQGYKSPIHDSYHKRRDDVAPPGTEENYDQYKEWNANNRDRVQTHDERYKDDRKDGDYEQKRNPERSEYHERRPLEARKKKRSVSPPAKVQPKDPSPSPPEKEERPQDKVIEKIEKKKSIKDRLGEKIPNPNNHKTWFDSKTDDPPIINSDRKVFLLKRDDKVQIDPMEGRASCENTNVENNAFDQGIDSSYIDFNIPRRKREDEDIKSKKKTKTHRHSEKKRKKTRSRSKSKDRRKKKEKKHKKDKHKTSDKKSKHKETTTGHEEPQTTSKEQELAPAATELAPSNLQQKSPQIVTERNRVTLDEATFEPDYSASDNEHEAKDLGIELKISEQEELQLELQMAPQKPEIESPPRPVKPTSTEEDSSAASSTESDSSDDSYRKRKKKHKKHKKRKAAKKESSTDTDSDSDDTDSSSEEERRRKKSKKSKSSKSKHSKSKKKKSKHKDSR